MYGIVYALNASLNPATSYEKLFMSVRNVYILDLCNTVCSFVVFTFLTGYLSWLLSLDESRFRGAKHDFKVELGIENIESDLLKESHRRITVRN